MRQESFKVRIVIINDQALTRVPHEADSLCIMYEYLDLPEPLS